MTKLQGHRGVCTEYPENTMVSFEAAIEQGYDYIEIDPAITKDGVIVLLHDVSLKRTARNDDGSGLSDPPLITQITYDQALKYDFGAHFHPKFKGQRIPRLIDVLELAKKHSVKLKLDNKIWNLETHGFDTKANEQVLKLIKDFKKTAAVTCNSIEQIKKTLSIIPDAEIHYDGAVNEITLSEISKLVPKKRLTVWLPTQCRLTRWVKVPFVSEELSKLVKHYASLGVWIISDHEDFTRAVNVYGADIIETNGQIKPEKNKGLIADMHSHTASSHDAVSKIEELCSSAIKNEVSILAITDHFDGVSIQKRDPYKVALSSTQSVDRARSEYGDKLTVLKGIELGEAFWAKKELQDLQRDFKFDVIIGSVHAVRYKGFEEPFSVINFGNVQVETVRKFYNQYLDDMIENIHTVDFDILAHLDNPLKYIRGKYGFELDMSEYAKKIDVILNYIIGHGIALEVNTATLDIYGECMPTWNIVKRYKELGGYLITVGADSHAPDNVGKHIKEIYCMLKKLGFYNVYYYNDRKSYQITI